MKVRDAMAGDVTAVSPHESVAAAARAMHDAGVGFLPVVDAGRPVGVVTDRDIVVRFLAAGGGADASDTPVSEIMTARVGTIGPDDDLAGQRDRLAQ